MTLGKAIWVLERHFILHFDIPRFEIDEAAKLGMEALKAYRWARQEKQLSAEELLPGETKE